MRTVYKYSIPLTDHFSLSLPIDAQLLAVQTQYGMPQLWALVETDYPTEDRYFRLAGTGHTIEVECPDYVGTFQIQDGALIFHLFEISQGQAILHNG